MLRSVRPRLSLCLFRARSSKRCILGLQLLQNTNRKPHAESQTYWSAWPCGHRKWPKRAENIVSPPLSGRYLVSCPLRYSFSGFGMQNSETGARLMKAFTGRRRHSNSARTCHPPPLRSIHIQPLLCANP